MARVELIPEHRANGTIALRAVEVGAVERLKRLLRRLSTGR
jgi:hypothetical protein